MTVEAAAPAGVAAALGVAAVAELVAELGAPAAPAALPSRHGATHAKKMQPTISTAPCCTASPARVRHTQPTMALRLPTRREWSAVLLCCTSFTPIS